MSKPNTIIFIAKIIKHFFLKKSANAVNLAKSYVKLKRWGGGGGQKLPK